MSTVDRTEDAAVSLVPVFADTGHDRPLVLAAELVPGAVTTFPVPGRSPFQDQLAAANATARDAARARLERFFPGFDFEDACQNVDARRFAVLRIDDSLLEFLDGPAAVDRLLTTRDQIFANGGVTFSRGDLEGHQPPPPGTTRPLTRFGPNVGLMNVGGLSQALRSQWTTILNAADRNDPALGELMNDFSRVFGCDIQTNIYLSQGPAEGFGPHWDMHDTFIVQVHGAKEWALFNPLVLSPQRPWIDRTIDAEPIWEGTLEPGYALYIPRGWGHEVRGSDDLTMHYTIGVNRLEVHKLLERVAWDAGYWPVMRADVPFHLDRPAVSYAGSVFDDEAGLADTVVDILRPGLVERALASFRSRVTMRMYPSLVDTFRAVHNGDWSGLAVRLPAPSGIMVHDERESHAVIAFDGRAIRIDRAALAAFAHLATGKPVVPEDLPPVLIDDVDVRPRFIEELVSTSVAEVVRLTS